MECGTPFSSSHKAKQFVDEVAWDDTTTTVVEAMEGAATVEVAQVEVIATTATSAMFSVATEALARVSMVMESMEKVAVEAIVVVAEAPASILMSGLVKEEAAHRKWEEKDVWEAFIW
jgi:hypothetical protein